MEVKALRPGSVPAGYKQTEVGLIPDDWEVSPLEEFTYFISYGFTNPMPTSESGIYMITAKDINHGRIQFETARCTTQEAYRTLLTEKSRPKKGDLLLTKDGTLGRLALVDDRTVCINQSVAVLRPNSKAVSKFLKVLLEAPTYQNRMLEDAGGSTIKHIYITIVNRMSVALPPTKAEQEAIAEALSDADALIDSLEQLLVKKRHLKQGAMQELLTGKKRLAGFNTEWKVRRIADIACPSSEKNSASERLPVLTCSKHLGFVDSLGYFRNQIFSKDTSGYKVIKMGQIGYPANHIEEGSIGLQNLYNVALVSPIYVVFSVNEEVDSYFLHRLLKLDSYRQEFETATSSSVDRRGSLRWPTFSQIMVSLPLIDEQTAISAILRDMDAEIAALEAKLAKTRQLKQGMMQELLTGRIRLV